MYGIAFGNSTRRSICPLDMPIPRAASFASGGTSRMPMYVFARITGVAKIASAGTTDGAPKPTPATTKMVSSPYVGMARARFVTVTMPPPRPMWPSQTPSGSPIAVATSSDRIDR